MDSLTLWISYGFIDRNSSFRAAAKDVHQIDNFRHVFGRA
jgi:hypothetical protein